MTPVAHAPGTDLSPETGGSPAALEERYFRRMAAAGDEKSQLTAWLRGGRILDIGAGGGELAAMIAELPGVLEVVALDNAPDAIAHLNEINGITVRFGAAGQLDELGLRDLDGIVMSSVLHEIASYNPDGPAHGRQAALDTLATVGRALAPGGVLVIRDFVMPADPDRTMVLATPGHDGDGLIYEYLDRVPVPELAAVRSSGSHTFTGSARALTEALLTVNWGAESFPRETQEQYCQFELEELAREVTSLGLGLTLVHSEAWVQPGYREHLAGWSLLELDGTPWFPETKAVWVFERSARLRSVKG